jgi:hypothetical protein
MGTITNHSLMAHTQPLQRHALHNIPPARELRRLLKQQHQEHSWLAALVQVPPWMARHHLLGPALTLPEAPKVWRPLLA